MVTCNFDSIKKMERPRRNASSTSNSSSGFRLLDGCDTVSSVSRNSIYKLKIDAMFDDTKSVSSHRMDDIGKSGSYVHSQQRNRHSKLPSTAGSNNCGGGVGGIGAGSNRESAGKGTVSSTRSSARLYHRGKPINITRTTTTTTTTAANIIEYGVECVNNKVQKQIERMFTDVAKDESACCFPVRCLGSLPLRTKVTSLYDMQEPLRKLYLTGAGHGNQCNGNLEICGGGLRVRPSAGDMRMTPFHNIAVWSAVKFVVSQTEGGAAFLPLITDPENIDKKSLYQPLSSADKRRLSSGLHAPIFAVVMRSMNEHRQTKQLECHAFVCQTPENAIVMAATLYQSLLAHMSHSHSDRTRKPRNQNGVSCISLASGSVANRRNTSMSSSAIARNKPPSIPLPPPPPSSQRPKHNTNATIANTNNNKNNSSNNNRLADTSLSSDTDAIVRNALLETSSSSDQRKKKSHKTRRAPSIPQDAANRGSDLYKISSSYRVHQMNVQNRQSYQSTDQLGGDIMTRVAIPRSGSFLNTSGLARYKSHVRRAAAGKSGGGGGSPLGFSELFNEFRLQENLHSLDDILNAIIDSEGMSFNDLKPIYKEFLLKLAVTLTKDELYQRSKSIMRRQKKKLMRHKKNATATYQFQRKNLFLGGSKRLKRMFRFSKYFFQSKTKTTTTTTASLDGRLNDRPKKYTRNRSKAVTSGSDLSETQNEMTFNGQNRNSSSGYVSYSECSYNSDACTCASADRCYCSLGADHDRLSRKLKANTIVHNRDTLISCRTEDKCYCSLDGGIGDGDDQSSTTFCDTDSCISTTKCYCKHKISRPIPVSVKNISRNCVADSLALDYELFHVGHSQRRRSASKHVRSQEALSVKKSVEMAAVFADVKLSQTTDITNIVGPISSEEETHIRNNRRNSISSSRAYSKRSGGSQRSKSSVAISKTNAISTSAELEPLHRKKSHKINDLYQTMTQRAVSTTLEDSLGYLP